MQKKKHKIFDVFLFFNELDLLELRLQTLYSVVDYFIITEINETFSGKPKKLIFEKNKKRFKDFEKKIIYNPITKKDLDELKNSKWSDYVCNFNKSISSFCLFNSIFFILHVLKCLDKCHFLLSG